MEETAENEAKTIYAKNKLLCEEMLKASSVNFTILRISVAYGNLLDTNHSSGTVGFFIRKVAKGNNITLYGDGSLKQTFSYVADLVNAILITIQLDEVINECYNIGGGDNISLLATAYIIVKKYKVGIESVDWPEEALKIESGDTILSDKKIQKVIDYNYQYSLHEWIKK